MANPLVTRTVGAGVNRVPGLRRVPLLKLLAAAHVALLARDHVMRLNGSERRRLLQLVRIGGSRHRSLTDDEREELAMLVARMEPRVLAGYAVDELSPFPLPGRLLYGPRRKRPRPKGS